MPVLGAADFARGIDRGLAIGLDFAADNIQRILEQDVPDAVKLALLHDEVLALQRHADRYRKYTLGSTPPVASATL